MINAEVFLQNLQGSAASATITSTLTHPDLSALPPSILRLCRSGWRTAPLLAHSTSASIKGSMAAVPTSDEASLARSARDRCNWAVAIDADPKSLNARRARASIDIYGLNRAYLVRQRSRYMRRAQRSLTAIVEAAHHLDGLRADQIVERQLTERLLVREFAALSEFTDGQDSHPGMLERMIRPVLATLTVR